MSKPADVEDFPPFVAIGPDELGSEVEPGTMVVCRKCGGAHPLTCATDEFGQPTKIIMAFRCGTTSYLGAVSGRLLHDVRLAASEPRPPHASEVSPESFESCDPKGDGR